MRVCVLGTAAIAAGVMFTGQAQAGFVTATLNSIAPVVNVEVSSNTGANFVTVRAGLNNFTGAPTNPAGLDGPFTAFCIDFSQTISLGGTYTDYTISPLANAPTPPLPPHQPMGPVIADQISELWGRFRLGLSSNEDYAAFQVAIWELIYDNNKTVTTGDFQLRNNATVAGIAQGFINAIDGLGPREAGLFALTSGSTQDMLVPAPGAGMLLGAAGLVAVRRKRR